MGLMDDMKSKSDDIMDNPENREKIQKIADDKGINMDEARKHFIKKKQEDES